ncbi:MAG: hypothetical protein IJX99_05725, partial [Clostridia bacterium]|nr:hypothetical protein [Clostridia bacterium]
SLYFYVGETVRDEFLINVGEIASNFADKVDVQQASGAGMPSGKAIYLTLGATGSTYTAPANGYFTLSIQAGKTASTFIRLQSSAKIISEVNSSGDALRATAVYIPVKKDDVVTVTYDTTGTDSVFMFTYAEGEV